MNVYLIGALVVAFMVAGAGVQGYRLGGDHVRAEYAEAQAQAQKEADAYATGLRASARRQAQNLQTALAKQKGLNRAIGTDLEEALRKAAESVPAGCPAPGLSDGLRDLWNRANHASDGSAGRIVPGAGGTSPGAAGAVPSGGNPESR